MNALKDIAQLTRLMENAMAKRYVTDRWQDVIKLSEDKSRADKFIDALLTEKVEEIAKCIYPNKMKNDLQGRKENKT